MKTIDEIVSEMRALADDIEAGRAIVGQTVWRNYADLIEASGKREKTEIEAAALEAGGVVEAARQKSVGNAAAMRKALEEVAQSAAEIMERVRHKDGLAFNIANYIVGIAKAALSAPPRNCDVGSDEEQAERFEDFCLKHIGCADETGGRHCLGCPLEKASNHITQKCELYWAQMPYDGGESNGSK